MKYSVLLPLTLALAVLVLRPVMATSMVGGQTKSSTLDPESVKAADFAVSSLNGVHSNRAQLGDAQGKLTLLQLKDVSTQVVAGTSYHLLLSVSDESGRVFDVAAVVWSRPWLEARNDENDPAWQLTKAFVVDKDN